jgi:hypothetical protein
MERARGIYNAVYKTIEKLYHGQPGQTAQEFNIRGTIDIEEKGGTGNLPMVIVTVKTTLDFAD